MSTATYERPLRAVPAPPEQRERFAFLLAIRRRAEQTLNALLALPLGAAGWALRHLRALTDAASDHRVLGWVGARLRGAVTLARAVGIVPLVAAVLSTPPVWRGAQRVAATAGSALAAAGGYLWARAQQLLSRCGTTGQRIEHALSEAGSAVSRAACAVVAHPAAPAVTHAAKAGLRLVRAVSRSVVVHRLLRLIPMQSIRIALELIVLPLVLALGLPEETGPRTVRTTPEPTVRPLTGDQATTHATESRPPIGESETEPNGSSVAPEPVDVARNRAERRAQQQEQARAKRARAHR
ncbi:hypothetical protein BJ986_002262 [Phycicoccus badiiscoriae]|uniref:Uncharacterized protein n=1 Tax=Pedococcus badiiscoriae TaxID=642776 RepID=A0A852WNG8_9MICO|nr:hypothetical protein [Pedococcus badiiscoriae]NYG07775.1 hypothetical protein [Pedococcus badiiscoriae]